MEALGVAASITAIAGAAITTANVVKQLRDFGRDVRTVDETVRRFSGELQSLHTVLDTVRDALSRLESPAKTDENAEKLWRTLGKTGENCLSAVTELKMVFERLADRPSGSDHAYQAILRQLKLQSKSDEIAKLRKKISVHHRTFQTCLECITIHILCQDRGRQPDQKKFEAGFVRLEDKLDDLTYQLTQLKTSLQDQTTVVNGTRNESAEDIQAIDDLEECRAAARAIYSNASVVMDRMSTTGSEFGASPTTAQRDDINSWAHDVPLDGQSTGTPSSHPVEAVNFDIPETFHSRQVPDPDRGQLPPIAINISTMSADHIEVRSKLINDALLEYSRSLYKIANRCFKEAYEMGTVGVQHPSAGIMGDETLRLRLYLTAARLVQNTDNPKKACQNLQSSIAWDLSALQRRDVSLQDCCDTLLRARIHLYTGNVDQAGTLCDGVLNVLSKIENSRSREAKRASYIIKEAVIILVEILYSKGSTEAAKTWRTKVSMDVLKEAANPFMKMKRNKTEHNSEDKYRRLLQDAARRGNFPAALYILSTIEPEMLGFDAWTFAAEEDYIHLALQSDSLANISLLLEYRSRLELYPHATKTSHGIATEKGDIKKLRIQRHLFAAIECDSLVATELLLRGGAGVNGAIELSHFSHDSSVNTETLYEFYELQAPKVLLPPLGLALSNGQRKMSELLLRRGANINGGGESVEPPLNTAIRSMEGRHLVFWLLKKGADVNLQFQRVQPLALALYHLGKPQHNVTQSSMSTRNSRLVSRRRLVELLINAGADVNRPSFIDNALIKPLKQADIEDLKDIEKMLLHASAQPLTLSERLETTVGLINRRRFRPQPPPILGGLPNSSPFALLLADTRSFARS